jgi:hypothetical protein
MPLLNSFTPPTTSLYQFMALSGLLVFMFFRYLKFITWRDIAAKFFDLQRKSAPKAELESLSKKLEMETLELELVKERLKVAEDVIQIEGGAELSNEVVGEMNKVEAELLELFRKIDEQRDAAKQDEITTHELEIAVKKAKSLGRHDKVVSTLGIAVSVAGFVLWYVKIQQYQDMILLKQALEH